MPKRPELVRWQWATYHEGHTDRANLILHLVTVPVFWAGTALLVTGCGQIRPAVALAGAGPMLLAVALQGVGHRRERTRPIPFLGPIDFVTRFFAEQFVNFPRFVLGGAWTRALRRR